MVTKSSKIWLGIIVLALAVGGYFLWQKLEPKKVEEVSRDVLVSVPTVSVVSKTLFREDQLPGEIEA